LDAILAREQIPGLDLGEGCVRHVPSPPDTERPRPHTGGRSRVPGMGGTEQIQPPNPPLQGPSSRWVLPMAPPGGSVDGLRTCPYLAPMSVSVRQLPLGGNLTEFLDVVGTIYRDDPHFVRPLDFELKQRLSRKNPFFRHGEGTLFTA